jgi:hypothetical protein
VRFTSKPYFFTALVIFALSTTGCTLRKRNKPLDDKAQGKVAVETPTPAAPNSKDAGTPAQSAPTNVDPRATENTPANLDASKANPRQAEFDSAEFKEPTLEEPAEEVPSPGSEGAQVVLSKKRFTGFLTKDSLAYTDSAMDSLMTQIRIHQQKAPESQSKQDSLNFAKQIRDIKILVANKGNYTLQVVYGSSKDKPVEVKLTGKFKDQNATADLQASTTKTPAKSSNSEMHPEVAPEIHADIQGTLRCMEAEPTANKCSVFHVTLKLKQASGEAVAEALLRSSEADVRVKLPSSIASGGNAEILAQIFSNSESRKSSGSKIETIRLQSFAVVNGRSEFQIRMLTSDNEYLYFKGPLLASFGDAPFTMPLISQPELQDPANAKWAQSSSNRLAKMVINSQLVANDGRGSVKVLMTVKNKKSKSAKTSEFQMTFTRKTIAVTDLIY